MFKKLKVCEHCGKSDQLEVTYSADWCNRCKRFVLGKYEINFKVMLKNVLFFLLHIITYPAYLCILFYFWWLGYKLLNRSRDKMYNVTFWDYVNVISMMKLTDDAKKVYHSYFFSCLIISMVFWVVFFHYFQIILKIIL